MSVVLIAVKIADLFKPSARTMWGKYRITAANVHGREQDTAVRVIKYRPSERAHIAGLPTSAQNESRE